LSHEARHATSVREAMQGPRTMRPHMWAAVAEKASRGMRGAISSGPPTGRLRVTLASRPVRWALIVAAYTAATVVMTAPIFNFAAISAANYEGDARLIIWTLAWDNHAVLHRLPLFESNTYYPAANSLAYNEHLFGQSLFTLPVFARDREPRSGLQPRVVARLPPERRGDARAPSALRVQRSRGVHGQHHFHVLFL
jgi:hypothetical protein